MIEAYQLLVGEEARFFDEGMEAFDEGISLKECPYVSRQKDLWVEGWKHAEENPVNEY